MFQNDPKIENVAPLTIIRPTPRKQLRAICLSAEWRGVETHYLNGRTIRHKGDEYCAGCIEGMYPRWQGYIVVRATHSDSIAVLQFTPTVAAAIHDQAPERETCVGLELHLERLGKRPNSPVRCTLHGWREVREYPMSRLEDFLKRLFRENES